MSLDNRDNLLIWPVHGELNTEELIVFKGAKEWAYLAPNDYDVICRAPDNDKE